MKEKARNSSMAGYQSGYKQAASICNEKAEEEPMKKRSSEKRKQKKLKEAEKIHILAKSQKYSLY